MDKSTEKFFQQPILFKCPQCNTTISFKINQAGSEVNCHSCKNKIRINKQITYDEYFEKEFPEIIVAVQEILSK